MEETAPLTEVKARLSEFVDRIQHRHERIVVTRNGRPAAVLLSPDELQALEETLELLADAGALAEIEEARRAIEKGDAVSAEDLQALRERLGRKAG